MACPAGSMFGVTPFPWITRSREGRESFECDYGKARPDASVPTTSPGSTGRFASRSTEGITPRYWQTAFLTCRRSSAVALPSRPKITTMGEAVAVRGNTVTEGRVHGVAARRAARDADVIRSNVHPDCR